MTQGHISAAAAVPNNNASNVAVINNVVHGEIMLRLCKSNAWGEIQSKIEANPELAVLSMAMSNSISTTILHQAITSRGDARARAAVIKAVLDVAPKAATIRNGYGSLPLHVIMQRNTKMDAATKETAVTALLKAFPDALVSQGGVGKRTPLHIAYTDYVSPHLVKKMIDMRPSAARMKDKKGWLPIHVACSRHCSPQKLQVLLQANPESLFAKTNDGDTPFSLATSTATKSHPNYLLIGELRKHLPPQGGEDEEVSTNTSKQHSTEKKGTKQPRSPNNKRKREPSAVDDEERDDFALTLLLHFHDKARREQAPPPDISMGSFPSFHPQSTSQSMSSPGIRVESV